MSIRRVAVLGSTGSIGVQALEIIDSHPDLELHSILCRSSLGLLRQQRERFKPAVCAISENLEEVSGEITSGRRALEEAIEGADIVLNAIVGSAGLGASLLCQNLDIPIALANKESLVVGGELLRAHLDAGKIIPVDSEHSTIFRCLQLEREGVRKILLTASGGSTLDMPSDILHSASPQQILKHPTWDMGSRITVDSATMVNKAFEVIEAQWLFGNIPVEAVIHPQSVVHSLVCLEDGSWKALLGEPDMRIPIQYALLWPDGRLSRISHDDPLCWQPLEFRKLDNGRYPAFGVVEEAGRIGRTAPAAVNAADEIAVEAFLKGDIPFGAIPQILSQVLSLHEPGGMTSFQDVLDADSQARTAALLFIGEYC